MYKRQVARHGDKHRFIGFQLLTLTALPLAVDVESFGIAPGHMVEKTGHVDAHIAVLQGDKGGLKGEGAAIGLFHLFAHLAGTLAAVSYTHLDVYKRQLYLLRRQGILQEKQTLGL